MKSKNEIEIIIFEGWTDEDLEKIREVEPVVKSWESIIIPSQIKEGKENEKENRVAMGIGRRKSKKKYADFKS